MRYLCPPPNIGVTLERGNGMIKAIRRWLSSAPIDDEVDRRNAPMVQIVLLLIGILPPLMWAHRVLFPSRPIESAELIAMAMSLAISAVAWTCLVLIRRGRFRIAVGIFLTVALVNMVIAYAATGLHPQRHAMPVHMIWMVMAGLVLGRRALWRSYGMYLLAFALATRTDIARNPNESLVYSVLDSSIAAIIFLLIAIVVDRSVAALRESLAEVRQRSDELDRVNQRLRQEMIEREHAEQRLLHAQKMKAIGRLASGVAHDFNNVLSVVLGYAARRAGVDDLESARRLLSGIEGAAQRGTGVAKRLLDLSRPEKTRIDTFDAAEAVRQAMPLLRQMLPDEVRIELSTPDQPLPIRFDRSQFDLVILNIAANARDAMPEGGRFRLAVRLLEAGRVELGFTDTGIGMSADTCDNLFEPFFTTKPAGEGYGLGLAVVKNLVTEAGGDIRAESTPEQGTTLLIRLPQAEQTAAGTDQGESTATLTSR